MEEKVTNSTPEEEVAKATEETIPQENQEQQEEEVFEAKYNHETIKVPKSEAAAYIQKGMNYDKVLSKAEELEKQTAELNQKLQSTEKYSETIGRLAQAANLPVDEYLTRMEFASEYGTQPMNLDDDILADDTAASYVQFENFKLKKSNSELNKQLESVRAQEEQTKLREQRNLVSINRLLKENPELSSIEDVPEDVYKIMGENDELIDVAYAKYKVHKMQTELESLKGDNQNAETSTGSAATAGNVTSPFFTREQVEKMTQKETNQNWGAILNSMKNW